MLFYCYLCELPNTCFVGSWNYLPKVNTCHLLYTATGYHKLSSSSLLISSTVRFAQHFFTISFPYIILLPLLSLQLFLRRNCINSINFFLRLVTCPSQVLHFRPHCVIRTKADSECTKSHENMSWERSGVLTTINMLQCARRITRLIIIHLQFALRCDSLRSGVFVCLFPFGLFHTVHVVDTTVHIYDVAHA